MKLGKNYQMKYKNHEENCSVFNVNCFFDLFMY